MANQKQRNIRQAGCGHFCGKIQGSKVREQHLQMSERKQI